MKLKTKPTESAVARVTNAIRFAPNPLPQLTPENLAAFLDSFARGYLRDTALLWDAIQWRDDRVGADSAKRYKAVPRYGYQVMPADGQDPDDPRVQRHVDAIEYALENCTARDVLDASVRGGISMLARQMMHAVGHQWRVHELVWKRQADGLTFDAIAMPLWWFERITGALRYLPHDLAIEGEPLEAAGWMVTRGDGIMAPTSLLYLLKRMALTDWALYNGRVGPGIHGTTSAAPGSDDWERLEEAVDNFDFDLKIVTQTGVLIEPIEMALKGVLPWPEMYTAMTKAITVLWRGGNLMTDGATGGGEQRGVSLQAAEGLILEHDDAEMVSNALNDYVVGPLIAARFGEESLAWVEWQTSAKPDQKGELAIDEALNRLGWRFTAEDLAERYNRTPPQEGQTVLVPPAAAPAIQAANAAPADATVNALTDARAKLLEPFLARVEQLAQDKTLTDGQFLEAVEAALPALADGLTLEALADMAAPLEAGMRAAVEKALAQQAKQGGKRR